MTSSRITMVSLTCRCSKFTQRSDLVAALPLHPLMGKPCGTATLSKFNKYFCWFSAGGVYPTDNPLTCPCPCQCHVASSCRLPATLLPGPRQSKLNEPVVTDGTCILFPVPSSAARTPHLTGSQLHGRGSRASLSYS